MKKKRQGYQVVIRIERFVYDPQVASNVREIIDSPATVHGNWSLGDYRTAEEADDAIGAFVHIKPPFKRGFCGCTNL